MVGMGKQRAAKPITAEKSKAARDISGEDTTHRRKSKNRGAVLEQRRNKASDSATVRRYRGEKKACSDSPRNRSEYISYLDNEEAIKKLPSTEKGERFQRYCSERSRGLNCLVPTSKGYRTPIP
ncbi:hypothetical protein HN51_052819 [Arachis hypogaea]